MLTVTGAIFGLMDPAQGTAQAQPEVADMQQRMRVGTESLFKELVMAGAGPYQGATTGSLINFFAPILPRRTGLTGPDPTRGAASVQDRRDHALLHPEQLFADDDLAADAERSRRS